jgi:hypothetical protein
MRHHSVRSIREMGARTAVSRLVEMQPVRLNPIAGPSAEHGHEMVDRFHALRLQHRGRSSGAPQISSELPFSTTNKVDAGTFITKTGR